VIFERLAAALRDAQPVAVVTRLDGAHIGGKLLVFADEALGTLGDPRLDAAAAAEARARLAVGENAIRSFGEEGEPIGDDVRVFICSYAPKPDMYIFGAIDFSRAMAHVGKTLGYRVTVVDARPLFATRARIPDADDVVVAWPDEFLAGARVDARSALIVLTHDVKFDVPLLQLAVRTPAGYIGAMGSRNTHANRVAALREAGVADADIARIYAPVGLDIGARTPEETAVSIAAEIIAAREGRSGGHLAQSRLPIHNPRAAATV
jgi:xanthine dehydrogenase accessory factor